MGTAVWVGCGACGLGDRALGCCADRAGFVLLVTAQDERVLCALCSGGRFSAAEIFDRLSWAQCSVQKPSVYRTLVRLLSLGWISGELGEPGASGPAPLMYAITDNGRARLREAEEQRAALRGVSA